MRRSGVTLVELVVVLAIISVLVGIFIPAVGRAREAAREAVCKNKLRQINLALVQINDLVGVPASNPEHLVGGWAIEVLPFMEQVNFRNSIPSGIAVSELDESLYQRPDVFECPTQANIRKDEPGEVALSHYLLLGFPSNEKGRSYSITEAPSSINVPWAASPELDPNSFGGFVSRKEGPHYGGFYTVNSFNRGVEFMSAN